MKPHPRIRQTIKWTGAAVTVLLVAILAGTWTGPWSVRRDQTVGGGTGSSRTRFQHVRLSVHYAEVAWVDIAIPSPPPPSEADLKHRAESQRAFALQLPAPTPPSTDLTQQYRAFENRLNRAIENVGTFSAAVQASAQGRPALVLNGKDCLFMGAPLWQVRLVLCALIAPGILIVRSMGWGRVHAGSCPNCHYDRAGIARDAVCPECGSAEGSA